MERKRDIFEISSFIAEDLTEMIQHIEDGKALPEKEFLDIIHKLEKLDEEGLGREIDKVVSSKEEKELAHRMYKSFNEAEAAWKNGERKKLKQKLENIVEIDKILFERIKTYDLRKYEAVKEIGSGAEGTVFQTQKEGVVIKLLDRDNADLSKLKRYYHQQKKAANSRDVNFSEVLAVGLHKNDRPAILMKRVPGTPIRNHHFGEKGWTSEIAKLAEYPVDSWIKLRKDFRTLRKYNISPDMGTRENFFRHDKTNSFYLIDLSRQNPFFKKFWEDYSRPRSLEDGIFRLAIIRISSASSYSLDKMNFSQQDLENVLKVRNNILEAGFPKDNRFESTLDEMSSYLN